MIELYIHPEYTEFYEQWRKATVFYYAKEQELKRPSILWQHELERKDKGQAIRQIREQRSTYTNFLEGIVSIWQSLFIADEIQLDEQTKTFLESKNIFTNIDGKRSSLTSLVRDSLLLHVFLYGKAFIYVSAPNTAPQIQWEAQQMNFQAQWQLLDPLTVLDWGYKDNGKLAFVRTEYQTMSDRSSGALTAPHMVDESKLYAVDESGVTITTYRKVKNESLADTAAKWEVFNIVNLPEWAELPIVELKEANSWVSGIQQLIQKHFNLESTIDNILLYQAHQRICYIGNKSQIDSAEIAEYSIQLLPEGSSIQVIQPVDTGAIERRIDKVIENIFKIGLNQSQSIVDTAQARSADSLREEKRYTYNLIASEIEMLQNVIEQAIIITGEYYNQALTPAASLSVEEVGNSIDTIIKIVLAFRSEFQAYPEVWKAITKWALEQLNLKDQEQLLEVIATTNQRPTAMELIDKTLNTNNAEEDDDNAETNAIAEK